jgi:hypothetical protein
MIQSALLSIVENKAGRLISSPFREQDSGSASTPETIHGPSGRRQYSIAPPGRQSQILFSVISRLPAQVK